MGGRKLILPTSPVQPSQSASGGQKLIDDRSPNESCIETKKRHCDNKQSALVRLVRRPLQLPPCPVPECHPELTWDTTAIMRGRSFVRPVPPVGSANRRRLFRNQHADSFFGSGPQQRNLSLGTAPADGKCTFWTSRGKCSDSGQEVDCRTQFFAQIYPSLES